MNNYNTQVDQVHYQSHQLRSIKTQVVIKATLFLTVMYLILEAINYYYSLTRFTTKSTRPTSSTSTNPTASTHPLTSPTR